MLTIAHTIALITASNTYILCFIYLISYFIPSPKKILVKLNRFQLQWVKYDILWSSNSLGFHPKMEASTRYLIGDFYWPSDINFSCRSNGLVRVGEYDKVVRIKYPYVFLKYATSLLSSPRVFEKWATLRHTSCSKIWPISRKFHGRSSDWFTSLVSVSETVLVWNGHRLSQNSITWLL